MSLGDILRDLLEEGDISQKQFADSMNIGASTLGNYIQNIREPDYETLKRFADYFSVSIDYLLGHVTNQTLNYRENELLRVFRALTNDQQELFIEQGKIFIVYKNKKRKSSDSATSTNKIG